MEEMEFLLALKDDIENDVYWYYEERDTKKRTIEQLIKDDVMPPLYFEVLRRIKASRMRIDFTITPEMIEAGRSKWERWKNSDNPSSEIMLRMIYRAMRRLEPRKF